MSESTAGVSLRVQQLGAEGVRARLREINDELRAGQPVTKALKQEVKELGTQVNTQNRVVKLSSAAWNENHRTLQSAGRVMSAVSSVARSALAITTTWSLATMAFGKTNIQLMEVNQEIERIDAQMRDAMARGASEEELAGLQDRKNVLVATRDELKSEETQGAITNAINLAASIALIGSGAIGAAQKIGPLLAEGGSLRNFGGLLGTIAGRGASAHVRIGQFNTSVGRIAGVAVGAGLALVSLSGNMDELVESLTGYKADEFNASLMNKLGTIGSFALMGSIGGPPGIAIGGTIGAVIALTQTLQEAKKAQEDFLASQNSEEFKNRFDSSTSPRVAAAKKTSSSRTAWEKENAIHSAYLYSGRIANRRARGGMITEPIMGMGLNSGDLWSFGENGSELVVPSGGAAGRNVIINVYGDVSGRELVNKVRNAIKENLRDRGFTGF